MTSAQFARGAQAVDVWDGAMLLDAFAFATRWLDHHRDRVNALNVFPIPDGDTGTNMALTMNASIATARDTSGLTGAGAAAGRLAHGALMGARGNSGVILSQIFRGFAAAIADRDEIDGRDLARAFDGARAMAYKAVMRPVEGTMLSVIRVAAERAAEAASRTPSVASVLQEALAGAEEALAATPEQLDILRQAGVVDAGGQGVVYMLDGLHRFALGNTTIDETDMDEPLGAEMAFLDNVEELHGEDPFGYCTNFMVFGENMDFERVRADIAAMGQSVVVVGDDAIVKVHIHTESPGNVLQYALGLGYLDQIKIDNMTLQTEALTTQREHARHAAEPDDADADLAGCGPVDGPIGVIAVAAGTGLVRALRSMGADCVVRGGQTMNPSTEELLQAVQSMPVDQVIILPNNTTIHMAANQVSALTEKQVEVVPSRSVPQGLAALSVFNRDTALAANVEAMTDTLQDVHSIELTQAVRDVELNGVQVVSGQCIGLIDGDLVESGPDVHDVAIRTLARLRDLEPELLTVFAGEGATPELTQQMEASAAEIFPDAEIEVLEGNQPHYRFLISLE
ncbi:MAG TPA: DAK2 domain-containing protein [Thermomicrobiales bacterium]|nr:DAK2 domain-containing protein [Thermomicrobiales bacterium]